MLSNLLTVTGQVATLFLMMAVGFVLGRAGKMTEAGRSQMSYLLLYIVCPCVMVDCFLVERTPALTQEVAVGSAAALACYLLFFAVSLLFFRRQPADARDTLRFAAVYGNIGFMGLPLVQSILGEEALVYGALALLAFNLTSWTLGVLIMGGRAAFSLRRAVLNPGVVGIGLGLLCFLSGLRFPSPVGAALSFLSDLNTPLAMVVIGTQLAEADLPSTFRQPRSYLVSFLRLALSAEYDNYRRRSQKEKESAWSSSSAGLCLHTVCATAPWCYCPPRLWPVRPASLLSSSAGIPPLRRSPSPCQLCSPSSPCPSSPCWPEGSACSNRKRRRGRPRWGGRVSICAKTSCA